jgi:hypothetical protein
MLAVDTAAVVLVGNPLIISSRKEGFPCAVAAVMAMVVIATETALF